MKEPFVINKNKKIYFETAKQKVLEVFFIYPEKEFSLSELAKEAKVSKPNLGSILNEFLKEDLIEIVKLPNIWRIKSNQTNQNFIKNKIVYNLYLIYQSGLIEFLNNHFKNPRSIVLFGSFRKGEDISSSDVDIAVECDVNEYSIKNLKELSNFEKFLNRKIQLHLFNRKYIDIHLFNNILNGIVLMGFLENKQ